MLSTSQNSIPCCQWHQAPPMIAQTGCSSGRSRMGLHIHNNTWVLSEEETLQNLEWTLAKAACKSAGNTHVQEHQIWMASQNTVTHNSGCDGVKTDEHLAE